jgi:hypothetical protein
MDANRKAIGHFCLFAAASYVAAIVVLVVCLLARLLM